MRLNENRELTKAELEIMQVLWDKKEAFVKDILEELPEPKPAYNTVSTIVRILEKKGFVNHKNFGNTYQYYPAVDRAKYASGVMHSVISTFFGGSASKMVSFLSSNKSISLEETEEIIEILKKEK